MSGDGRSVDVAAGSGGVTPLGRFVEQIEQAFDSGDHVRAAELVQSEPIMAWFGLRPDRFIGIIDTLAQKPECQNGIVRLYDSIMKPGRGGDFELPAADDAFAGSGISTDEGLLMGKMFMLRYQGHPVKALRLSGELASRDGALQPLFDLNRGWGLFLALQNGVTAMLAGDFTAALRSFTQARMHVRVPALAFLTRDAYVKAALVEATYGGPECARALLAQANEVPRTESWAEATLDVARDLAVSLLPETKPEESIALLEALPLHEVGEIWPYYANALHRALVRAGRLGEAKQRLAEFEGFPLPRSEGEGYSGSVLALNGATVAMLSADLPEARRRLERADGSLVVTRLAQAFLALVSGSPREALRQAAGLHGQTASLRSLDLSRLAVIAGGHLALGEHRECRYVIETVLDGSEALQPYEVAIFTAEVQEFASAEFEQWPAREGGSATQRFEIFPEQREALTQRERDILRELSTGASREEIAKQGFITMNTLKAHLRAIYRKLGVRSRTAAVLEAERRGLT